MLPLCQSPSLLPLIFFPRILPSLLNIFALAEKGFMCDMKVLDPHLGWALCGVREKTAPTLVRGRNLLGSLSRALKAACAPCFVSEKLQPSVWKEWLCTHTLWAERNVQSQGLTHKASAHQEPRPSLLPCCPGPPIALSCTPSAGKDKEGVVRW